MMKSANQLYKESNSEMPFKDWLKNKQSEGVLENHEKMFNANGKGDSTLTIKKAKKKSGMLNIIGFVSLGVLIYGLTKASASE